MNRGILSGLGAYLIWGFIPVYFKLLKAVPAVEIMFHRVIWSLILLIILITSRQQWALLRQALRQPRLRHRHDLAERLAAVDTNDASGQNRTSSSGAADERMRHLRRRDSRHDPVPGVHEGRDASH